MKAVNWNHKPRKYDLMKTSNITYRGLTSNIRWNEARNVKHLRAETLTDLPFISWIQNFLPTSFPRAYHLARRRSLVKPDRNAYRCLRLHTTHRWRNIKGISRIRLLVPIYISAIQRQKAVREGDIMKITAYVEMGAIQYKINKSQTDNKRPNDTTQYRQILLRNEWRQVNPRAAGSKKDNENC